MAPESPSVSSPYSIVFPTDPAVTDRTYCVVGSPRGGTTMVARLIEGLGISIGARCTEYAEDLDFLDHKGIRDIFTVPERRAEKEAYLTAATAAVEARNAAHRVWGWKDPTAIYYLPELFGYLRNPHFVCITRDPGAVAQTEMAFEPGWPADHILAHLHACSRQFIAIAEFLAAARSPTLMLSYERTLRDPRQAAQALQDFAGQTDPAYLEWAQEQIWPRRGTA